MERTVEKLDALIERTKKNTSSKQAEEGARLLIALYLQSADREKVANYICTLHASVCQVFFERAVTELEVGKIQSICDAIRNNEQYKKNNSYKGTIRGYTAAAVLIKNQDPHGKAVLMDTISDAEKNDTLPPKAVELFTKHVIEYCHVKMLNELKWKDALKQQKFINLLEKAIAPVISPITAKNVENPTSVSKAETMPADIDDDNAKQQVENNCEGKDAHDKNSIDSSNRVASSAAQDNHVIPVTRELEALLKIAQKANSELHILLRTIVNTNETPSDLRKQIANFEEQMTSLREQIKERDRKSVLLESELDKRNNLLAQAQANIDDLTARLTKTLQLDTSANNQELVTIRTDISNSLKLEYQDYMESRNKEQTSDQFEAYKASLFRIFKTLRRFGITFE